MTPIRTYYDVLSVARDAPTEVIEAAGLVLTEKRSAEHGDEGDTSDGVLELIVATAVLKDPIKRAAYDAWIADQEPIGAVPPPGSPTEGYSANTSWLSLAVHRLGRFVRDNRIALFFAACPPVGFMVVYGMRQEPSFEPELLAPAGLEVSVTPPEPAPVVLRESPPRYEKSDDGAPGRDDGGPVAVPEEKATFQPRTYGYVTAPSLRNMNLSTFTIDNTSGGGDAELKLIANGDVVRHVHIQRGHQFVAEKMPAGDYELKYLVYKYGKAKAYRADRVFTLTQESNGSGNTRFTNAKVTLFEVSGGDLNKVEIPLSSF